MKQIQLTKGFIAIVDDADFEVFGGLKWTADVSRCGIVYARRVKRDAEGRDRKIYLHRAIMGEPAGLLVDHRDGDGLHCWRLNLRVATRGQNNANSKTRRCPSKTSAFKGVAWHPDTKKWAVQVAGSYIGLFSEEADAAREYDRRAAALFGDFARLNFPIGEAA